MLQQSEHDELRAFANDAEQVALMTSHRGWEILSSDIEITKKSVGEKLPYLDPKSSHFMEARLSYLVCDKLLKMVEDYAENRKRTVELLDKLDKLQENVPFDVDNES